MHNLIHDAVPVIAIDGPSASGKGTIAELVAAQLGFHYLDSGALYRIVALAAKQQNIDWNDAFAVAECAKTLSIEFKNSQVFLNGADISEAIRTEEMGKGASRVAVHAPVRAVLVDLQHSFRTAPGLVADGRDMGTVIFPDAALKVFLTAATEVRAQRRYQQLINKKQTNDDLKVSYDDILQDLRERDARDQARASAPLTKANEAILLETDHLGISEAVAHVMQNYQLLRNF